MSLACVTLTLAACCRPAMGQPGERQRADAEREDRAYAAYKEYSKLGQEKEAADALVEVGDAVLDRNASRALDYYWQALNIYRKLKLERETANPLKNMGAIAWGLGEYAMARSFFAQLMPIYAKLGLEKETADAQLSLGVVATVLGEYASGWTNCRQALAAYLKLGLDAEAANASNNLGIVASRLGDYAGAQTYYEDALARYRRLGQERDVADALNNLGSAASRAGRFDQALNYYGQALATLQKAGVEFDDTRLACNTGDVYREQGRYGDALRVFEEHPFCGEVRTGRVHLLRGSYAAARGMFQSALGVATRIGDAEGIASAQIGLGLAEERLGAFAGAEQRFRGAIELMEEQRTSLSNGDRQRFLSGEVGGFRRLEAYEGLVRVLQRLRKPEDAFYWSEHTRARGLVEAIARSADSGIGFGVPEARRREDRDLADRIGAVQSQIAKARRSLDQDLLGSLQKQLSKLKQQQQVLIGQLRRDFPEYAAIQYPQPLSVGELALRADEALLVYEVTDTATIVFVVRAGKLEKAMEVKVTRKELAEMVAAYRRPLVETGQQGKAALLSGLDVKLGHRLYELLLKDALAGVKENEKVLVVPDEMLSLLPLEALVEKLPDGDVEWAEGKHGRYPKNVAYAGDRRVFSYWQSASALTMLRQLGKRVTGDGVLVVADPVFNLQDARLSKERTVLAKQNMEGEPLRVMGREIAEAVSRQVGVEEFGRLPGTAGLLERLRIPYGERLKALVGLEANKTAVRGERMERYGAGVIFATHGIVDERVPYLQQAALVLSNPALTGESPEASDGFLTMSDVLDLKMPTELVAALACETGLGSDVRGEGVMHLGRAFQYAGARSALMSLWSVEDESTNELGARVLAGMEKGEGKDAALLAARRLLREKGYEHPFFWAGFILVGERDVRQNRQTEQK